jgi:hypothetical protein
MSLVLGSTADGSMDRIRFLHVPKTAGTSFMDCLTRIYGGQGQRFIFSGNLQRDYGRYGEIDASKREQLRLIAGHSPRITGIPEIDSLPTITFLRDPLDRVKSFCQHVSEGKSPDLLDRFPPERFSLDEFLECGNAQLSNFHSRMLLGERGYELPTGNPDTLVDRAMSVLQHDLECFGIVEEFESSLMLFRSKLDWQKWPVYRPLNVRNTSQLIEFSSEHMAAIRELNTIDVEVYQNALEVFHKEITKISDYVEANLPLFRDRQRLWAQQLELQSRVSQDRGQPAKTWPERCTWAFHILRTQGLGDLRAEIERFIRWSLT